MKQKYVAYRRKREGRTDYKLRLRLLSGHKPRISIRKSLKYLRAQVIEYHPDGDKVLLTASTKELPAHGWKHGLKNTTAAYLLGLLTAKKAKEKGISAAIIDLGIYPKTKGNKLFAVIKGIHDGKLKIPLTEKGFPTEERMTGKHLTKNKEEAEEAFNKTKTKLLA